MTVRQGFKVPSHDRIWARLHNFQVVVREGEILDDQSITEASAAGFNPFWLVFTKKQHKMFLELTGMTLEELQIFRRVINTALDTCEEIVTELDALADASIDQETLHIRAFRAAPPLRVLDLSPRPRTEAPANQASGEEFDPR